MLSRLRDLERRTRPRDPAFAAALARRWAGLPDVVKTPGQVLGRFAAGCEGTHGVFPACNLACTPCYHSRDANRVRVDGAHTREQVEAQMALLERERGPRAHAQLIGGEVTLLPPDDHAATLLIMRRHGREPMSMTHGDVDEEYLERLVLGPDGRRRLRRVSFAAHFDMMMFGRRGIPRPPDEAALHPYRRRFAEMFARLRRRHGVRSFLAHNMTVTPANVEQIPEVVREVARMGYGMLSFQPAAYVGDERRWRESYRGGDVGPDAVWAQIERGVGRPLDHHVFENGDVRCNRTAYGFYLGERWHPFLDGDDARDLATRDAFFRHLSGVGFGGTPPAVLAAKLVRLAVGRPRVVGIALAWLVRTVRRVGVGALLRHRPRPVTFVMHQFMDAADVAPAWDLVQRGITSDDPGVRATQERLAACHYAMAHPEDGTLVPACVQHGVLDPAENAQLKVLLPMPSVRRG
ncbi:radical SAM protein [Pseudonocardia nigra]|uniref:radical SAM protein n=1 Tax=Pseudonocardia nigra TaxID=1921578 RepID=UPI001C5D803F|nr:radical SAM protein [Pseudonocardia nigra]